MDILRLREIREDKDISQGEIARFLKVTQPQYSRYESGINTIPIEKLDKLASFYNTSTDYLLCRTDERTPYPHSKMIKYEKKKEHTHS